MELRTGDWVTVLAQCADIEPRPGETQFYHVQYNLWYETVRPGSGVRTVLDRILKALMPLSNVERPAARPIPGKQ